MRVSLQKVNTGGGSIYIDSKIAEEPAQQLTPPPLPANFIPRSAELAALREVVLAPGGRDVGITALAGMGGIGKTILAQALCADETVQKAFSDGIFWLTIGKESRTEPSTFLRDVARCLHNPLARLSPEQASIDRYRISLRGKAVLIVLDDVWNADDVEPFRNDSTRSRLLFTTRNSLIAATLGAQEFTANLLTEEQSRAFLARLSNRSPETLPFPVEDLIRECGRLPLALSMIGASLRGKPSAFWKTILDLLRNADLEKIKAQFPNYPHNLFRAIKVSVDALDPGLRERYIALAVLLEDMVVETPVLQTLWNATKSEALEAAEELASWSLAMQSGDSGALTLHDLQLDYVRVQSPLRTKLPLIHSALRLSAHVVLKDARQFAGQMRGRLLRYADDPTIRATLVSFAKAAPRPWLSPRHSSLTSPGGALIRTLTGHLGSVTGVALSADGRRAVSSSEDKTLKVWEVETGREVRTLMGHLGSVTGVALSSDGRRAVSASEDKTLKVWDVETGREVRTLTGHWDHVTEVALSSDGHRAVSASEDKTLKVWDVETGREVHTLTGEGGATMVALSKDGRRAVSSSFDGPLMVWDVETGRKVRTLTARTTLGSGVALSADGRRAIDASWFGPVRVWDVETGAEIRRLVPEGDSLFEVRAVVSGDGRRVVSCSSDGTLRVWDVETGAEIQTLAGHSDTVKGVALSGNERRAISASKDKTLKVWDLETDAERRMMAGHRGGVSGIALSSDGRHAVSASWDCTLKMWDLETGEEVRTLAGHLGGVSGVALSCNGRHAVSASWDRTLKVWDVETGGEVRTLAGHSAGVNGVALSGDGRRAVSASEDKTLKVWDVETGREIRTLVGHLDVVKGVALSGNGRCAISASSDRTLKVWDVETGEEVRTLAGHLGSVNGVALSGNGCCAISASEDKTLKVWDVETGREIRTLAGHLGSVNGATLSGDGWRAVSASKDNTLNLWDVKHGAVLATFTCDVSALCCAWNGSGTTLTGDGLGRVHFLTLELPDEKDLK